MQLQNCYQIFSSFCSFLADSEIGKKPVTEILTFNVTDSSRNVVPDQVLTVVIQPDDNQPPVVEVLSGIKVSSGGYARG